jgi:hypothetical protein
MDMLSSIVVPAIVSAILSVATTYFLWAQSRRRLLQALTRRAGYILACAHPEIRAEALQFVREEFCDLEPEDMRAMWPEMEATLRSQAPSLRGFKPGRVIGVKESILAEFRARVAEGAVTGQGLLDQMNAWVPPESILGPSPEAANNIGAGVEDTPK